MKNEEKINQTKVDTITTKELVWYAISGIIIAAGLVLIILNLVGTYASGNAGTNPIKVAESSFMTSLGAPISFLGWGLILLALGVIVLISTLAYNAKKSDKVVEQQIRRQQRLSAASLTEGDEGIVEEVEAEIEGEDNSTPTISAKEM